MKQKTLKSKLKKYKMTEREIFEKYANLIEDELSKKSNKTKLSQQKSTKATIFCAQNLLKGGNLLFCVS